MNAALKIVPEAAPKVDYDNAVEFLAHVTAIGNAWTQQIGGFGGFYVHGKGATFFARWGNSHDRVGTGLTAADACLDLVAKLARDLKEWSKSDELDLAPALAVSIHLLKLEDFEVVR